MRIAISHTTRYRFDEPASYGLQRLRLTPRDCTLQSVVDWHMEIEGGVMEVAYEDHNQNRVALISFGGGAGQVAITCSGVVETRDAAGVAGPHTGFMPLWQLCAPTELTRPGPALCALAGRFAAAEPACGTSMIGVLHDLAHEVGEAIAYDKGHTHVGTTAEEALVLGKGVCQDQAHAFIAAVRLLGLPARYVSGYLLMDENAAQEASHGWAEAHVPGLGWVGFDVANDICPDERYVRLAVGADYRDAAPVISQTQGCGEAQLEVAVAVQQRMAMQ
ncbi:MAG TPA: transglutaminase family protein [Novosphingobium sp.]|nr:transglutaminase family protein [Novosphingobium sp.]HZV09569.1 transglutaminase family protein [Novosphingobium sp.]